jgi:DNA replication protein DnaC
MVSAAAAPDLLVLDDVGALSDWARTILFRVLNQRELWERPTILTTNLDLQALEAAVGKRTFDRFGGNAVDPSTGEQFVCELQGASLRGRAAGADA